MSQTSTETGIRGDGEPPFERMAILGLGLLGGSVALAARKRGAARSCVGAGRRRGPLEYALEHGIVDEIGDIKSAARGADLVVLATPVSSMPAVLEEIAPQLAPGAIVTDVGSVKGAVAANLPNLLPDGVSFVGSHPMAGSHLKGVENARVDLFDGACCVVTPVSGTSTAAVARLRWFWETLGARVRERSPADHDEQTAWISHAPHVLAFAFAHALRAAPHAAGELAGSGIKDFTRIARSDAALWGDILSANRNSLAAPLELFRRSLGELALAIEAGDADKVEQFLASASEGLATVEPGTADD